MKSKDSLNSIDELLVNRKKYLYFSLEKAAEKLQLNLQKIPYTLRILLENILRNEDGIINKKSTLKIFSKWLKNPHVTGLEFGYSPARILMQDYTGVPSIVDLATMRDALVSLGKDPLQINPLIPVDLVIDHSVQVDVAQTSDALSINIQKEMERNRKRYQFLKWGQQAFSNFSVVPTGTGICHQVNLEYLAKIVYSAEIDGKWYAYPDTVLGLDSHTTMINGLGVLGWGVGGIEAESAMLGQSISLILPEVIGIKLVGSLPKNTVTATDLALTITEMLRHKGVVGKFVEFFGPGMSTLSLENRATISNMSPEYGATCAYFPIDDETIKYATLTARTDEQINLIEIYSKKQKLWYDSNEKITYTDVVELDLSSIETSISGPARPQDRIALANVKNVFSHLEQSNYPNKQGHPRFKVKNQDFDLGNGDLVIAAITSCTNTSNPAVMVTAALLAKKACELGIFPKPWVKTSFAPGSRVVTEYLRINQLDQYLDKLGFNLVGYGCTTCIGNSGPLISEIQESIQENDLIVGAILSGNRNFENRIHPYVKANYLASPPLVVAYSLVGNILLDISKDPLAIDHNNQKIYLQDLWPTHHEVQEVMDSITPKLFKEKYSHVFDGDENWLNLKVEPSDTYPWSDEDDYIKQLPYFKKFTVNQTINYNVSKGKILAVLGDSITTDHISPAGAINVNSPAGKYLIQQHIHPANFNSYGSRRGNYEVMARGTFANPRIKNLLLPNIKGGNTIYAKTGEQMSIYDAAMNYQADKTPLIIFAGKEYGSGSSRDWAAKGPALLGIKAIVAKSFERIHRSNLLGMGILPLTFVDEIELPDLGLDGNEEVDIRNNNEPLIPHQIFDCIIKKKGTKTINMKLRLEASTKDELEYIVRGGILQKVINDLALNSTKK